MPKIPGSAHVNLSLGLLVMVGGVMGYVKKSSTMSLISGVTVGSLLMGSGYMIARTDRIEQAHWLATGTTGLLAMGMGYRFYATGKFFPAGMVASLGMAACAYNYGKALEWADSSSDTKSD